jgi:hypothetical protein
MRASNVRSARETLLAHSRAYPTAFAVALILLCIPQAHGQITITPATISAPVIQSVPGTCADYNAALTTIGVQMNSASNPGHCVKSQWTAFFNGQPIGTQWQQLMLGPNPPKFKQTTTPGQRSQVCVTATDLNVDLSARIDVSELNWSPTQTIGPVCTNETSRVNTAPRVSVQALSAYAQRNLKGARLYTKIPNNITACGLNTNDARTLLYQKIWALMHLIATEEQKGWKDPENAQAAQCAPRCNLCNPGWVGTLTCTKTSRDTASTNYTWDETQTWTIGGVPVQMGGTTDYPATFTATGGGSKGGGAGNPGGVTWSVNVTAPGTLNLYPTPSPSFQTSQIPFPNKDIPSTPAGYEATEVAFQIPAGFFLLSPTTYTEGNTTPPPAHTCNLPQMPGSAACRIECSWKDLSFQ